jgi:hypothetical protein
MADFTSDELEGLLYGLELAVDDQENYLDSGCASIDYEADDLAEKGRKLRNCGEAAQRLGQTRLAERFSECADTCDMLAVSKTPA